MTAPAIILVRPQMGENIGAVARSMKNFGLHDLRIVVPRDGWPNPKAVDMAKHAKDILSSAYIAETLDDALSNVQTLYATTARPRDIVKVEHTPHSAIESIVTEQENAAIMFGPERTGLTNEDIACANAIISIPVNPEYPSLNIAQAVTVTCYEWFARHNEHAPSEHLGKSQLAHKQEIINFVAHLSDILDEGDFFKVAEKRHGMLNNITNMFARQRFTDQEIRTLHGIIQHLRPQKPQHILRAVKKQNKGKSPEY